MPTKSPLCRGPWKETVAKLGPNRKGAFGRESGLCGSGIGQGSKLEIWEEESWVQLNYLPTLLPEYLCSGLRGFYVWLEPRNVVLGSLLSLFQSNLQIQVQREPWDGQSQFPRPANHSQGLLTLPLPPNLRDLHSTRAPTLSVPGEDGPQCSWALG